MSKKGKATCKTFLTWAALLKFQKMKESRIMKQPSVNNFDACKLNKFPVFGPYINYGRFWGGSQAKIGQNRMSNCSAIF